MFALEDQSLEMKELVIHASAEDPAYGIIRNAIKKRTFHRDQIRSLQTSIYLKGVARSRGLPDKIMGSKIPKSELGIDSAGKGVVYLAEEYADYYASGKQEKTIIHSVHESGRPNGLGFSQFPSVITFYDNDMQIFEGSSRGFISPISDNALNYYKYKLLGQFDEHGHTIYKIRVTQKRDYEPCFNGTIYIVDSEWAIHSLNMLLTKKSNMDLMDTLNIDQIFIPLQKDNWVIKSQVLYYTIKFMGIDGTASFVTVYNNQKVNQPIPDSIFANKITSIYDKNANKKDSAFWKDRPVPLEKDEKRDFVVKDSIHKKISDPAYRDSVRRKNNQFKVFDFIISGSTFSSKEYINTYSTNSLLLGLTTPNILNYNIVEGFNVAPKLSWRHRIDTGEYLHTDIAARYGFSNTHFNAVGRIYYTKNDRQWIGRQWLYGIEGGKYVYQYNPDNPVLEWFNTYADLLYRQNDLKIYERWDASAYLGRKYGNGLDWFVKTSYQQRLPLQNTTDYSIWGGNSEAGYTNNLPPHLAAITPPWVKNDAALVYATISYKPGYSYTQYPDYKVANGSSWPTFTLNYEKGIPGIINSVSNFDKWRFSIIDDVRLKLLGSLKYNIAAGGFLNSNYVAIPDLMHLYGDRGIGYASPYLNSFQFAQYYQFSNKEPIYGEAHVEYHLNGLLTNKIPLLRQARYYLLFGGNVFYAGRSDYYTEAFVGLDNIGYKFIRVLRVDFVQSWDSYMGHNSGIRFGLDIPGVTSGLRSNPTHSEW